MKTTSISAARALLLCTTFATACGQVETEGDYLPLSALNEDQASMLTAGANADELHSHSYLPLSEMSADEARALTGGGNADALHTHAAAPVPVAANPWVECGTIVDFQASCSLKDHSPLAYEYGISYLGPEPLTVRCTAWNRGVRLYNHEPVLISSDNPNSAHWGGYIFYTGTDALDDNETCGVNWRHKYWYLGTGASGGVQTVTTTDFTAGCFGAETAGGVKRMPIYCRRR